MERRYLVAALAIIATFAVSTRGFHSLEQLSMKHARYFGAIQRAELMARTEAVAKAQCGANAAARAAAKVRTHLRPRYPEEAQLLAEMNVPIASAEMRVAEQMVRQNLIATQCARAAAQREAERAHRQAQRMRQNMAHAMVKGLPNTISLQVTLPSDFEQRIEEKAAVMAAHIAAQNVKVQMAANKFQEASVQFAEPVVTTEDEEDTSDQGSSTVRTHSRCKNKTTWQQQAARDTARKFQYSFTSK